MNKFANIAVRGVAAFGVAALSNVTVDFSANAADISSAPRMCAKGETPCVTEQKAAPKKPNKPARKPVAGRSCMEVMAGQGMDAAALAELNRAITMHNTIADNAKPIEIAPGFIKNGISVVMTHEGAAGWGCLNGKVVYADRSDKYGTAEVKTPSFLQQITPFASAAANAAGMGFGRSETTITTNAEGGSSNSSSNAQQWQKSNSDNQSYSNTYNNYPGRPGHHSNCPKPDNSCN